MTTLGRRVGQRRARLIAPASLLPDTGLYHLFSLANSKWLYQHLSVARASSVRRQGAPRAGEVGNWQFGRLTGTSHAHLHPKVLEWQP
ncbi:jg1968 [Pararge aegeria aegeria]|uniref:Jg1968 protein n=1 Tax=Pararge aegeria aegeria TaxID=348720 RepID=A0A8S4QF20_9NEOP|nr:jg1968 [Pararge aegeria aegeria]